MKEEKLIDFLQQNLKLEITPMGRSVEIKLMINTSFEMGQSYNYETIDSDIISLCDDSEFC